MPIEIQCPACRRKLRVPDQLVGRTVRCPSCKESFAIQAQPQEELAAETAVIADPEAPRPKRPPVDDTGVTTRPGESKRTPSRVDEDDERAAPPRRRRHEEDEDDEEDFADEEEEAYEAERRRKARRKRRHAAAAGAVAGPAIGLMCVGGLAVLLATVSLVLNLMGAALVAAPQAQAGGPGAPEAIGNAVGGVLGALFGICWGGILLSGGWQMLRLSSYAYAMTANIVAMVPCTLCCILGLPFGIWGLVVLCRVDVKDAFR